MARRPTRSATATAERPSTRTGSLACEASLNAAHTQTRLKITGAPPGGHKLYVIAMTPDDKRIDVGEITWDGDRGDVIVPFVARAIRLVSDMDDPNRVELVVDVLQDFIADNQPEPEPDPETVTYETERTEADE